MPTATGSDTYLAMIKQAPATPEIMPVTPLLQKIAYSSSDIGSQVVTTESANIKGNRRLADVTLTGFTVGGGIEAEMTYGASLDDELILNAIACEAWVANVAVDGDFYQPLYMELSLTTAQYLQYFGMVVDEWAMSYKDQALVTNTFSFVGLKETPAAVVSTGATYTDATDNPVFSTVSNVSNIEIDGVASGECDIKEWDINLTNNVTGKTGVGVLGACSTNAHSFRGTGSITMYFKDQTFKNKLKAGTPFSFGWTVTDANGNGYTFLLPKCKLNTDEIPISGTDDDIMDNAAFSILGDSVTDSAIKITRIVA